MIVVVGFHALARRSCRRAPFLALCKRPCWPACFPLREVELDGVLPASVEMLNLEVIRAAAWLAGWFADCLITEVS